MITVSANTVYASTNYASTQTAERFQADHLGRSLTLAGVPAPCPAVSFDGGLVF